MASKEYANLEAEKQYLDWADTYQQEIKVFTRLFVREYRDHTIEVDTDVIAAAILKIQRVLKAQMYRILAELFMDDTKFDYMREPEWWEGDLYDKFFALGKNRYGPITDALEIATDKMFEDHTIKCCMPKGRKDEL